MTGTDEVVLTSLPVIAATKMGALWGEGGDIAVLLDDPGGGAFNGDLPTLLTPLLIHHLVGLVEREVIDVPCFGPT